MHTDTNIHIYIQPHTSIYMHTNSILNSLSYLNLITLIPTFSGCGQQGVDELHHIIEIYK